MGIHSNGVLNRELVVGTHRTRSLNSRNELERMMKTTSSVLVCLLVIAGSICIARSAEADCSGRICNGGKITALITRGDTGDVFVVTEHSSSGLECTTYNGQIKLESNNTLFKEIYSMLLAAYVSNKDVYIRMKDSESSCVIQYTVLGW